MEKVIAEIQIQAGNCACGNEHYDIPIEKIVIGKGALDEVVSFLKGKNSEQAVMIVDENTYHVAGKPLSNKFKKARIDFSICQMQPDENGDVVADEKALVQLLLAITQQTKVLIAVGSGTIHDITRFCAAKMGIPFVSVPTAPSVDGFTSMGAPLIIRGVKTTFQMTSPIAVFADLIILKMAPREMIAAGVGDMLAKIISLADWKFGHLVTGEPFCPLVAQITREALDSCMGNAEKIASGDEDGIRILIESLIKSGLAMLLFGKSHPASGGEHHLSHYWEMEFIKKKRPQVLHGAKVGVSTVLLAEVYKNEFLKLLNNLEMLEGCTDDLISLENICKNIREIKTVYQEIPDASLIREILEQAGGGTLPEQLGIDEDLVISSLKEAYHLRNRFTALKFLNDIAKMHLVFSEYIQIEM